MPLVGHLAGPLVSTRDWRPRCFFRPFAVLAGVEMLLDRHPVQRDCAGTHEILGQEDPRWQKM